PAPPWQRSAPAPAQGTLTTTTPTRHGYGTPRLRLPHRGTPRRGAAGDRRVPCPAQNACAQRRPRPRRTTWSPRHGAPSSAWQHPALDARERGAVPPGYAPSAARHGLKHNSTVHAEWGKAAADRPGVDRGVERGYRA